MLLKNKIFGEKRKRKIRGKKIDQKGKGRGRGGSYRIGGRYGRYARVVMIL